MHNIPLEMITDEARRILKHHNLRVEFVFLTSDTVLNDTYHNSDLFFVLSTCLTIVDENLSSFIELASFLDGDLTHVPFMTSASPDEYVTGTKPVISQPLVFCTQVRFYTHMPILYPCSCIAYRFTKI